MTEQAATQWTDADRASWRSCCTLEGMRGWWTGSDCVVVGGGPSALSIEYTDRQPWSRHWTIGCNRSVNFCSADFAACFEPRKDRDVWTVAGKCSGFILSHIPRDHPRTILTPSKDDLRDLAGAPNWFGQSTFWAIACAITLGFETIGVIGLDLTEDRYPRTRRTTKWKESEAAYGGLMDVAGEHCRTLINLNPDSNLQAIPTGAWSEVRTKWAS